MKKEIPDIEITRASNTNSKVHNIKLIDRESTGQEIEVNPR